jgi:hypothetical protein
MEPLWSRAVAIGGSRWQMRRRKNAKTCENRCCGFDQLPEPFQEREGSHPCLRKKREVLRTRRPTGLHAATVTRAAVAVSERSVASPFEDLLQRREVVVYTPLDRAPGKLWQASGGGDQIDLRVEVHNGLEVLGGEPVAVAERCRP